MSRCLNCGVATKRMRRFIVTSLTPQLQNTLAEWLSIQELPSDRVVCNACYVLLNQFLADGTHSRALGYPMVCIGCGCSVMGKRYPVQTHRLEKNSPLIDIFVSWNTHYQDQRTNLQACHPCWMRANRHLGRNIHRQVKELQENAPRLPEPPIPPTANPAVVHEAPPPPPPPADNPPGAQSIDRINKECINQSRDLIPTFDKITSDDILCVECFVLLLNRTTSATNLALVSPALGHLNICFACGMSIANRRTHRVNQDCPQRNVILTWTPAHHVLNLERVCCACWEAASRRIQSQVIDINESTVESAPSTDDMDDIIDAVILAPLPLQKQHCSEPNEDSLQADNGKEIKVFCPKCNAEISHSAEGIQDDQIKIFIAKVYHYFEQEYEELKKSFKVLELTPLSKFRQRTALATGVSETTVVEILQEEARRYAEVREQPSPNESVARKRPRQTDREETLVVKEEPAEESLENYNEEPEIYEPGVSGASNALADPISIDIKIEPRDEEATSLYDTSEVQRDAMSYKRRKTKRNTDAPPAASAPPTPNAPPAASAPPTPNAPPAQPRQQLETLVVKEEPAEESLENYNEEPEIYVEPVPGVSGANVALADPISIEFKTESENEEATSSNDTHIEKLIAKNYKARKTKRNTETPPDASAPPAPNAPPAPTRQQLLLLDDGEVKMEDIERDEGFS